MTAQTIHYVTIRVIKSPSTKCSSQCIFYSDPWERAEICSTHKCAGRSGAEHKNWIFKLAPKVESNLDLK